jgi:hypothetical protein
MGAALYIVAKKKPADFDLTVDGKALARAEEALSAICKRIGVKSPMNFFSQNPGDLADMLGEEILDMPPEQWFEAEDGLQTVRPLLAHLTTGAEAIGAVAAVIEDLRQCERVLSYLEKKKIQWHFAIDV